MAIITPKPRQAQVSWARTTLMIVFLLGIAPLRADEPSQASLDGRWIYNAAKSRPMDPDLTIDTGSTAWVPIAPNTWRATKTRNDTVLETTTMKLSGSTLHSERRGKLPNGLPFERNVTYRRKGTGEGLVGRWRTTKVDTGSTWDEFVISTAADGRLTWRIPTDLQVITGRLDGTDLPVVGPDGPTGSTIAVRPGGGGRFDYVIKDAGHIAQRGWIAVSPDRRSLVDCSWNVDQPDRKSKLVYERERR